MLNDSRGRAWSPDSDRRWRVVAGLGSSGRRDCTGDGPALAVLLRAAARPPLLVRVRRRCKRSDERASSAARERLRRDRSRTRTTASSSSSENVVAGNELPKVRRVIRNVDVSTLSAMIRGTMDRPQSARRLVPDEPRLARSGLREDQRRVVSAEAHRVGERGGDGLGPRGVGHVVEVEPGSGVW